MVLGVTLLSILLNLPILSRLYGTVAPLVFAMVIRDLPMGVQMLRAAISQVRWQQ